MSSSDLDVHAILGGGKAADIFLWRNKYLSAGILSGSSFIWFLLQIMKYNFITLVCHFCMIMATFLFLFALGARLFNWNPPDQRALETSDPTTRWLYAISNWILLEFYHVSRGKNLRTFLLSFGFLWILSKIGKFISSLNLLFTGFLGLMILPALFEQYQNDEDFFDNETVKNFISKFLDLLMNRSGENDHSE